jgi:hypothetical protein
MGYKEKACLTRGCLILFTLAVLALVTLYVLLDHISSAWNFQG